MRINRQRPKRRRVPPPIAQSKKVECPYCGGRGDMDWFETHKHPPFEEAQKPKEKPD